MTPRLLRGQLTAAAGVTGIRASADPRSFS